MSTQPGPPDQAQEFHTSTERLITAEDVAGILGVSPKWVRNHATCRNPRLPYIAVGRLLRFRLSDVERFIDRLRRDGNRRVI
jgi:predicted DNA-binding transcriptional regulator AlpA